MEQVAKASSGASNAPKQVPKNEGYWARRKDSVYLAAAKQICAAFCPEPASVIDVGSNKTPTLEWHRGPETRLVSVDLKRPYEATGVESIVADFFSFQADTRFDLVTCFQVLEHVPDATAFAQKLLSLGDLVVVSVPYRWPKGQCEHHVHDPVDEAKMRSWFGRAPAYSYIAREPISPQSRLIQVYAPRGTPMPPRIRAPRKGKKTGKAGDGARRRSRRPFMVRLKNWLRNKLT